MRVKFRKNKEIKERCKVLQGGTGSCSCEFFSEMLLIL